MSAIFFCIFFLQPPEAPARTSCHVPLQRTSLLGFLRKKKNCVEQVMSLSILAEVCLQPGRVPGAVLKERIALVQRMSLKARLASKMSSCARVQDGSTSNQPFEFNASVDPCRRIHPECNFILNCELSEVLRMSNYILAGFK